MAEVPVGGAFELGRITIVRQLEEVGDSVSVEVVPDGLPLLEALGMLRLAEDTVLQVYAERAGLGEV